MALLTLLPTPEAPVREDRAPRRAPQVPQRPAPRRPGTRPRRAVHSTARVATRPQPLPCAGAGADPSRLRLTTRGRLAVALMWALLVLLAAVAIVRPWSADAAGATATREVVVTPGLTLWQLAEQVAPDAEPRATISEIVRLNDLPSAGAI
jgi:hypothetical protein